jgi:excisionase family DNA binding protein
MPKKPDNAVSVPNIIVQVSAPSITPRRFNIVQLAQYLNIKNYQAEELLRSGEIRFKWAGKHKVIEKADADTWADSQPYAEVNKQKD